MGSCPHTSFPRGKRILIIFNDGRKVIDKFVESKSGWLVVQRYGSIRLSKIRSTTIYRPENG